MTRDRFRERLAEICAEKLPLPGDGRTAERHRRLMAAGEEDLSLAKLAEAHWDAVAILAEAGRKPAAGAIYAVWASEIPGHALRLERDGGRSQVWGSKAFCSGAGIVDHALITVGVPDERMVEVELGRDDATVSFDGSAWKTEAFRLTCTGAVTFAGTRVVGGVLGEEPGWYTERPGFWHGACGPAACWAGGVAGLMRYALKSKREDAHTLAHLGAIQAEIWGMAGVLNVAGTEIDAAVSDAGGARRRALAVRHLIERGCMDVLQRFGRAYGPHPLAMDEEMARRFHEAELYVRQSHGERDLEGLGRMVREARVM